tara:strand:- start:416 stop:736 length:321 start_codon:yes stop_codon:yes gene_type:complete
MANNFDEKSLTISNNSLTDVYTASNKSMVVTGTIANKHTSSLNVTLKKYDNSGTATFTKIPSAPVPVGSSLVIPKIVLNTSDKIQVQSSHASGLIDVSLELLTDVS